MSIKCGSCGERHESVAEVKLCYATGNRETGIAIRAQMEEAPITDQFAARLVKPISPAPIYASVDASRRCTFGTPHAYGSKVCPVCHPDPERVTPLARNLDEQRTAQRSRQATAVAVREPEMRGATLQRTWGQANVEAGWYALQEAEGVVKFYKVDRPTEGKWKGYTFLSAQASDEFYPIKNKSLKAGILEAIALDSQAAMALYGREIGRCGKCNRTLTDEESRAYGIGPKCRSNS
jgi:Family of unknown function (DUF6011)